MRWCIILNIRALITVNFILLLGGGLAYAANSEQENFWEDLGKRLAEKPESACIVSTQCNLVQLHDSLYVHRKFSQLDQLNERSWKTWLPADTNELFLGTKDQMKENIAIVENYRDRKNSFKKSKLMPEIREVLKKLLLLTELDKKDKADFKKAVDFLDKNYLQGEYLSDALNLLPEEVSLAVTFRLGRDEAPVIYSSPTSHVHTTAGTSALSDVELMQLWVTKFSEMSRGIIACVAEFKQLENIPLCSEK
jgi:hypothetical protein